MAESALPFTPRAGRRKTAGARALAQVGELLETPLKTTVDVARLTRRGVEPSAVDRLVELGYRKAELAWVVPARTLTHRRKNHERLTPEESGRWFRAAKLQAMAREVFGDPDKALRWLHKPRRAFDGLSAIEVMQTEAGGQLVEDVLAQLDAGYFA